MNYINKCLCFVCVCVTQQIANTDYYNDTDKTTRYKNIFLINVTNSIYYY